MPWLPHTSALTWKPSQGTKLYCLVNRGTLVWTTCPRSLPDNAAAGNRTRNLSITSPAPYPLHHWATSVNGRRYTVYLIEVADDFVEKTNTLDAMTTDGTLTTELPELWYRGKHHHHSRVGLMIQVLQRQRQRQQQQQQQQYISLEIHECDAF